MSLVIKLAMSKPVLHKGAEAPRPRTVSLTPLDGATVALWLSRAQEVGQAVSQSYRLFCSAYIQTFHLSLSISTSFAVSSDCTCFVEAFLSIGLISSDL